MNNYSKLYWLTRLDNIQGLFLSIFILCVIAFIAYFLILMLNSDFMDVDEYKKKYGKYRKTSFWLGLIIGIITTFVPSKNEAIFIMAGGKTLDYVQSDTSLSKIPYQTTKIISDYLEKQIKDNK